MFPLSLPPPLPPCSCPQPIPENRPDLIKKYTGVTFAHFNNITFYRNPHAPSLLKKRLNGKLPPNANFGPHVINIKAGQVRGCHSIMLQ